MRTSSDLPSTSRSDDGGRLRGLRRVVTGIGSTGPRNILTFALGCALLAAIFAVVATGASSGAPAAAPPALDAQADCTLSDDEVPPGTGVRLSAFDSQDADVYQYDKEGDEAYDTDTLEDPFYWFTYDEPGVYQPRVRVHNYSTETTDEVSCGTLVVDENENPVARLSYSPSSPDVDEQITFDHGESSDADDRLVGYEYDWTDDGSYDRYFEAAQTATQSYSEPGTYTVRLRVSDEHGAIDTTTVTFTVGNDPPEADFEYSPSSPTVDEQVTFRADAADPDGTVEQYRWDFDGDNEPDAEGVQVQHSWDSSGNYQVGLTVVDDDGAAASTTRDVPVSEPLPPPTAICSVTREVVTVGESLTVDATGSDGGFRADFDVDGDEQFDESTGRPFEITHSYQEPGTYDVLVRVRGEGGADTASCGTVVVEREDEPPDEPPPPVALCSISAERVSVGDPVLIDATGSDGGYSAQFDRNGDGEYDVSSERPFEANVTFEEAGTYDVLVRVRGEGGTDTASCGTVVVEEDPTGGGGDPGDEEPTGNETDPGGDDEPSGNESVQGGPAGGGFPDLTDPTTLLGITFGALGLGGAAYVLKPGGSGGGGASGTPPQPPTTPPASKGAAYETGTFLTPPESGAVSISGLGFEPDLLLLVAANNVGSPGDGSRGPDRSDGWCHGTVRREGNGRLPQSVRTVADDVGRHDRATTTATDGRALELVVHDADPVGVLTGQVTKTTDDGFEMEFDVSALPEDRTGDQYVVQYRAFTFGPGTAVDVGHFRTPAFPGTQSIDLDVNANHVLLTATKGVSELGDARTSDLSLGVSQGDVVGRETVAQLVRASASEPAGATTNWSAAFDDRALYLPYSYDGEFRGRTSARVTALGDSIELTYDSVYDGPAKLGSTEPPLVTYVAIDAGELRPAIGYLQLPAPGETDTATVDVGFTPRLLECSMLGIDDVNAVTRSRTSPLGLDWSKGTVIGDEITGLRHYVLDDSTLPGGSTHEPPTAAGAPAAASARSIADGGYVASRADVSVEKFTKTGFKLTITRVGTGRADDDSGPYLFYKAWPTPDNPERTSSDDDGAASGGGSASGNEDGSASGGGSASGDGAEDRSPSNT